MRGLIAIPHTGMVPTRFMQSFSQMQTRFPYVFEHQPNVLWISHHWTHRAREMAAETCLSGYDWLFFIDSDMTFPPDTIERLLSHDLPVVSGLCFKREWPPRPTLYKALDSEMDNVVNLTEWEPLQPIDAAGAACLLIRRSVFEQMKPPYFALDEWPNAEDISFFVRLKRLGIQAYADTTVKCGHVGQYEYTETDFHRAIQLGEMVEGTGSKE